MHAYHDNEYYIRFLFCAQHLLAAQTLGVGSLVGGVVGTFTATTVLYLVVLLIVVGCSRCFNSVHWNQIPDDLLIN